MKKITVPVPCFSSCPHRSSGANSILQATTSKPLAFHVQFLACEGSM